MPRWNLVNGFHTKKKTKTKQVTILLNQETSWGEIKKNKRSVSKNLHLEPKTKTFRRKNSRWLLELVQLLKETEKNDSGKMATDEKQKIVFLDTFL